MRANFLLSICMILSGFLATAQENDPTVGLTKVQGNVSVIQGNGGNIAVSIGKDGVFMVDAQFAENVPAILEKIREVSPQEIRFLVNTHHHGDHTGGNIKIAQQGATVIAHDNVRERLIEKIKGASNKVDNSLLPAITFQQDLTFYYNGEKVMILHVDNAHTDGDAMVYFTESNVLHTGDTFFNGRYPFIDIDSGGDLKGYLKNYQNIMMLVDDNTKIIPGHGSIAKKKDVKYASDMLSIITKRVSFHYLDKKTEDEVVAMSEITAQYDAKGFGDGYISTEKLIRTLYKIIKEERGPWR